MNIPQLDPAKRAERLAKINTYKTFKYEDKVQELEEANEALTEAQEKVQGLVTEINGYLSFMGEQPLNMADTMGEAKLIEKIREVMPTFKDAPNGTEIAKAIGLPAVTAQSISDLYWKKNQSVLKKTGAGLNTQYFLATDADLESINASKVQEEAKREKAKAKREADKAKLAAMATAPAGV